MDAFLYPLLTLLYIVLFIWSFRTFYESSFWGTSWVLFILVALIYDSIILSIGNWIGVGEWLEVLSLFRYLLQVLLVPTLVFVSLDILRRIDVEWSEYLSIRIAFNLYTFGITVLGVFTEVIWIHLEPISSHGLLRYASTDSHFPFSALFMIIPLFIAAIMVWKKLRWPILLMGSIVAIMGGLIALWCDSFLLISVSQLILMWSIVLTEQKLKQEDFGSTQLYQ
ncbi:hypothetical protein [Hazenella coriacea]|uniref:Uncharacterized protein n=1 Tax=Hazenella coriacea TaxID=1179467 RepID=A0A4R3L9C8_9BACL|nr:hypothetical protein [Hazenella coriacea]TCS95710.1 hypothetical protein EDD58_102286 [Hazenella coriacea]